MNYLFNKLLFCILQNFNSYLYENKKNNFYSEKMDLFMSYDNYFYLVEFKLKILSI